MEPHAGLGLSAFGLHSMVVAPRAVVPRYSEQNSYLLGLVIVIGPVDCVDNPCSCRWRGLSAVDDPWTELVDNSAFLCSNPRRPQGGFSEGAVIHKPRGVIHTLFSMDTQACS